MEEKDKAKRVEIARHNAEVALAGLVATTMYEALFMPEEGRAKVPDLLGMAMPRVCLGLYGGDLGEAADCINRVRALTEEVWNNMTKDIDQTKEDGDEAEDGADNES